MDYKGYIGLATVGLLAAGGAWWNNSKINALPQSDLAAAQSTLEEMRTERKKTEETKVEVKKLKGELVDVASSSTKKLKEEVDAERVKINEERDKTTKELAKLADERKKVDGDLAKIAESKAEAVKVEERVTKALADLRAIEVKFADPKFKPDFTADLAKVDELRKDVEKLRGDAKSISADAKREIDTAMASFADTAKKAAEDAAKASRERQFRAKVESEYQVSKQKEEDLIQQYEDLHQAQIARQAISSSMNPDHEAITAERHRIIASHKLFMAGIRADSNVRLIVTRLQLEQEHKWMLKK